MIASILKFIMTIVIASAMGVGAFFYYMTHYEQGGHGHEGDHPNKPMRIPIQNVQAGMTGPSTPLAQQNKTGIPAEFGLIEDAQKETLHMKAKRDTKAFWKQARAEYWGVIKEGEVVFGQEDASFPEWTKIYRTEENTNITLYVLTEDLEPHNPYTTPNNNTIVIDVGHQEELPDQRYCSSIYSASGAILKGQSSGGNRIKIETRNIEAIVQAVNENGAITSMYVHAGDQQTMRVPDGLYRMTFITGNQLTTCNTFFSNMEVERMPQPVEISWARNAEVSYVIQDH